MEMGTYYHMDLAYRLGTLVHLGLVNLLDLLLGKSKDASG